jgi:tagatose 1,6-diphosphate aldolase
MDQRDALRKAIAKVRGAPATDAELSEFKVLVAEALASYATAILLDPEYGLEAVQKSREVATLQRIKNAGVILSYEKTGYDPAARGRLPALLSHGSVKRLVDVGANAVKVLLYYDPDDTEEISTTKQALVERVGAECHAYDLPFFLEVLAYSDEIGSEKSIEFARIKPFKVQKYMQEFSRPQYGVDVLKVEVPVNIGWASPIRLAPDNSQTLDVSLLIKLDELRGNSAADMTGHGLLAL